MRELHNQATQIRVQANADMDATDPTPRVAAVTEVDPLSADADVLYELLGQVPTPDGQGSADDPGGATRDRHQQSGGPA